MKPDSRPNPIFISKEGLSTFWFALAACAILGTAFYSRSLLVKTALRPQFLILGNPDVTTMKVEPDPEKQEEVATVMTRLAVDSIFNKSGNGLDSPERCKQLLSAAAFNWVQSELLDKQNDAFRDSRMHQKVEIESIVLHPQKDDGGGIFASVRGQLIRTGVVENKLFNEVWAVRAELMWTANPSLRLAGRYPMVCSGFSCRETPVASTIRRTAGVDEKSKEAPVPAASADSKPESREGSSN